MLLTQTGVKTQSNGAFIDVKPSSGCSTSVLACYANKDVTWAHIPGLC